MPVLIDALPALPRDVQCPLARHVCGAGRRTAIARSAAGTGRRRGRVTRCASTRRGCGRWWGRIRNARRPVPDETCESNFWAATEGTLAEGLMPPELKRIVHLTSFAEEERMRPTLVLAIAAGLGTRRGCRISAEAGRWIWRPTSTSSSDP